MPRSSAGAALVAVRRGGRAGVLPAPGSRPWSGFVSGVFVGVSCVLFLSFAGCRASWFAGAVARALVARSGRFRVVVRRLPLAAPPLGAVVFRCRVRGRVPVLGGRSGLRPRLVRLGGLSGRAVPALVRWRSGLVRVRAGGSSCSRRRWPCVAFALRVGAGRLVGGLRRRKGRSLARVTGLFYRGKSASSTVK